MKFSKSVIICEALSSTGVAHSILKIKVRTATKVEILDFMFSSANKLYEDCWFNLPAALVTIPPCQNYQKIIQGRISYVLARARWETSESAMLTNWR